MGWKKKIKKARRLHRPDLKDWERDHLYESFPQFVDNISKTSSIAHQSKKYRHYYYNHCCDNNPPGQFMCFALSPPKNSYDDVDENTENSHYQINNIRNQQWNESFDSSSVELRRNHEKELHNVEAFGYEEKKESIRSDDFRRYDCQNPCNTTSCVTPAVLDAKTLRKEEFWELYERKRIPCIIKNIPSGYDDAKFTGKPWPALKKWNLRTLMQYASAGCDHGKMESSTLRLYSPKDDTFGSINLNSISGRNSKDSVTDKSPKIEGDTVGFSSDICRLRNRKFKCGEDDDGHAIKVRLKHFLKYLQTNRDDSPLYIFDSSFERDKYSKSLLDDYYVPSYFSNDLFTGLVSEQRRPPYRWVLIGPKRSGSTIHIDPLATNAWNTLLEGQKRWCLFPPHVPKHVVKGKGLIGDDEDDEAIHYFMYILPRIRKHAIQKHLKSMDESTSSCSYFNFECYEFTQYAGETVFVPNGWWHAVLNITDTVGVTQNYVSERNFTNVWLETRSGRKRMAWKWLQQLKVHHPHLYRHALDLNAADRFTMKYDPSKMSHQRMSKLESDKKHRRKLLRIV